MAAQDDDDEIVDPGVIQVDFEHAFGSHTGLTSTGTPIREAVGFGDESGHYLIYPVGAQVASHGLMRGVSCSAAFR